MLTLTHQKQNNDYDTCLPNCQVIDGNVQVNAPGLIIPSSPAKDTAETVPSSATLDELLKKCQAACDPAGQVSCLLFPVRLIVKARLTFQQRTSGTAWRHVMR